MYRAQTRAARAGRPFLFVFTVMGCSGSAAQDVFNTKRASCARRVQRPGHRGQLHDHQDAAVLLPGRLAGEKEMHAVDAVVVQQVRR
jgi:hypothetical protein